MNQKIERFKNHILANRKVYIATAIGLVVGAATVLIIIKTKNSNSGIQLAQKINQIGFRNEASQVIINLVERSTPSKPVHLVGSNLYWSSISEAARETGHHISMISKNLNGHIPDVKGDVFEFLEKAA